MHQCVRWGDLGNNVTIRRPNTSIAHTGTSQSNKTSSFQLGSQTSRKKSKMQFELFSTNFKIHKQPNSIAKGKGTIIVQKFCRFRNEFACRSNFLFETKLDRGAVLTVTDTHVTCVSSTEWAGRR